LTLMEKFYAKLSSIRRIPELRDRIIFTLIMFLVARVGTYIPAPGIDVDRLATMTAQSDILGYINMFSGGAFKRVSIFALGIVPYINASIVFSLLAVIIPKIEEIQKDGEAGRNKINQWTRYLTIAIAIVQGFGVCMWLQSVGLVTTPGILFFLTTVVTLTAGTVFLMWIGEQISIKGIGNDNGWGILIGGLGGRIDHLLTNLNLIFKFKNLMFVTEKERIFSIEKKAELTGLRGKTISFVPFS
jgi:preprotein translocase subunit SecY